MLQGESDSPAKFGALLALGTDGIVEVGLSYGVGMRWIVQYQDQNTSEHIDSNGFDDVNGVFVSSTMTLRLPLSCCSCCRSHSLVGNWMSTMILIRMRLGLICSIYRSC